MGLTCIGFPVVFCYLQSVQWNKSIYTNEERLVFGACVLRKDKFCTNFNGL